MDPHKLIIFKFIFNSINPKSRNGQLLGYNILVKIKNFILHSNLVVKIPNLQITLGEFYLSGGSQISGRQSQTPHSKLNQTNNF